MSLRHRRRGQRVGERALASPSGLRYFMIKGASRWSRCARGAELAPVGSRSTSPLDAFSSLRSLGAPERDR